MIIKEFQEQMQRGHSPPRVSGAGSNLCRLGGSNIWPGKIPDDPRESHVTINPSDY